jgi:hypothetical protein
VALELDEWARREIRGHDLDYYVAKMEQIRANTLTELGRRDDQWLEEETPFRTGRVNNYFKWLMSLGMRTTIGGNFAGCANLW